MGRMLIPFLLCIVSADACALPAPTYPPEPTPIAVPVDGVIVAPDGKPDVPGTLAAPLSLPAALAQPATIQPGETVWLRSGRYEGAFTNVLAGTASAPSTVRAYPGEYPILDCTDESQNVILGINGAYTIFRDLEITCTKGDRTQRRPTGANVFGPGSKLINLTTHDTGLAIGAWTPAVGAEICGCLIFRNGWQGPSPDRGHGHGIYA